MDLSFEWVARDESMQGGVVLREEEGELAVVAEDLGREGFGDSCVLTLVLFTISLSQAAHP